MKINTKAHIYSLLMLAGMTGASDAAPEPFEDGIELDSNESYLVPYDNGMTLGADAGPLWLQSDRTETGSFDLSGGIYLHGTPIRLLLGLVDQEPPSLDQGKFEIWPVAAFAPGSPTTDPLFSVNSVAGTAGFSGLNVSISNGTLKVSGSPVVTQATIPTGLTGLTGQINIGNGSATGTNSMAIGLNGPVASATGAVALGKGTAGGYYSFASGESAQATASWAIAMGASATASGNASTALGWASATGNYSFATSIGSASGEGAVAMAGGAATGKYSVSLGFGTGARSYGSTTVGLFSNTANTNLTSWVATDPVFVVGNGTDWGVLNSSNALVTLKNGKSTLINKTWSSSNALADPDGTPNSSDADGVALRVEGHTQLQGKVTIATPQGDVSMGDYQ